MATIPVLVVDDDETIRFYVRTALETSGAFHVVEAENGAEALDILRHERIDVVLTDLGMPVMDGFHLLARMMREFPSLPVAVLTAMDLPEDASSRLGYTGMPMVFRKPTDLQSLADALQKQAAPSTTSTLRGVTLFGLLQLLGMEGKTGSVLVQQNGHVGRLFLQQGRLLHAETQDRTGIDAATEMLSWSDIGVEIFYGRRTERESIREPLQHVLMEAARRLDEGGAASGGVVNGVAVSGSDGAAGPVVEVPEPAPHWVAPAAATATRPDPVPQSHPSGNGNGRMASNIRAVLDEAMELDGAVAAALVDAESGMTLGSVSGNGFNVDVAAAGMADVVRSKRKVIRYLDLDDQIVDLLITLGRQYHLIRPLASDPGLFLYVALERGRANLGYARYKLTGLEGKVEP